MNNLKSLKLELKGYVSQLTVIDNKSMEVTNYIFSKVSSLVA